MEEKSESKMLLGKDEISAVKKYQEEIKENLIALASTRRQFLISERALLDKLSKLENNYLNHLKALAINRGMLDEENWVFDPNLNAFVDKKLEV